MLSSLKRNFLISNPPVKPPRLDFPLTRWQGIISGRGFFPQAVPTALKAFGLPTFIARSEYEIVDPYEILSISSYTLDLKLLDISLY